MWDSLGIAVVLSIHSLPFSKTIAWEQASSFIQPSVSQAISPRGIFPSQISRKCHCSVLWLCYLQTQEPASCVLFSPSSHPCKGKNPSLGYTRITTSKPGGIQCSYSSKGSRGLKQYGSGSKETVLRWWCISYMNHAFVFLFAFKNHFLNSACAQGSSFQVTVRIRHPSPWWFSLSLNTNGRQLLELRCCNTSVCIAFGLSFNSWEWHAIVVMSDAMAITADAGESRTAINAPSAVYLLLCVFSNVHCTVLDWYLQYSPLG